MTFKQFLIESNIDARQAYVKASIYLTKDRQCNTYEEAMDKHGDTLMSMLGRYASSVDTIVDSYYNMENYSPDGESSDDLWEQIEDEAGY